MIGSRKKFIIISSVLFILVSILIGFLIYIKIANMKIKLASKRKEIYSNAVSYCNSLYEDGIVKNDTTLEFCWNGIPPLCVMKLNTNLYNLLPK